MNCSSFETLLSDYMDDALDPRVRAAIDQHLAGCSACSSMLAEVGSLRDQLLDFPSIEPTEELLETVIEKTSGRFRVRSIWADFIAPTLRPFKTQRFAFATLMMFVFLSLVANVIGPDFSAMSFSDMSPSALIERADRFSNQLYRKWMQVNGAKTRLVGEVWRLKEDLYGRLDYHLINMLLRSVQESAQQDASKEKSDKQTQEKQK